LCQAPVVLIPPPDDSSALQVHTPEPTIQAAPNSISPSRQDFPSSLGKADGSVQDAIVCARIASESKKRRGCAREHRHESRQRAVGDVVRVLPIVHTRKRGFHADGTRFREL
jgi:hypothetical protein